ncbi:MAG TPA: lactate racemase domain-containing protein [Pirellulaceae bacterium]|jgi:hypothetical protein|nr:lactate racemase domain-containing protein [Pirellulaceae bacterium]
MRVLLGNLLGENSAIEVPAGTWISPRPSGGEVSGTEASSAGGPGAAEGWLEQLRHRLQSPLGLPPLAEAAFPGDKIVVSVDPETPQAEGIALEILRTLRASGVESRDITVLLAAGASAEFAERLKGAAAAQAGESLTVVRHDPADRKQLGYLAADKDANPIYVRRELLDADVIVPVGVARAPGAFADDSADGGLYPTFADGEATSRFADLRRQGGVAEAKKEARQVNWLLGTQFAVSVAPLSGDEAGRILAGEMNAVLEQSEAAAADAWSLERPESVGLAVACLSGTDEQQNWENFGRALAAADACATEEGAVAILSSIDRPPLERAEAIEEEPPARNSDYEDEEDGYGEDPYAAERAARETERAVPQWQRILSEIVERRTVYFACRLSDETVEELGMVALTDPSDLQTLVNRFGQCVWIRDGQYVTWASEEPAAAPARTRRKRKS